VKVRGDFVDRRGFLRTASAALAAGAAAPGLLASCTGSTASTTPSTATSTGALDALAAKMTGKLLRPGSPTFADENLPANDAYENIRPQAIALCADAADVAACVNWCRNEGVQPAVRGGGHNYVGASATTGLLIKTTDMNEVSVDRQRGTVTVQAGALNADLLIALRGGGQMLPIGTCPTVGVTGLALGGGIGDNSRWAGMTCDHLLSTDIVLASGEQVTASARDNPDLFWACRGGAGGNFGVNTSLTFSLVKLPVRTISVYGMLFHGKEAARAALAAFDKLMLTAPVQLTGFAGLTNQRPLGAEPGQPAAASLFPEFSLDGSYIGPVTELRDLLAPVTAAAHPDAFVTAEMEYWTAQIEWLAVPELPKHGFAEAARFTNTPLPAAVIENLIDRVVSAPGGTADAYAEVRLMCWSGGHVINGVSPAATAYVHRDSSSLLRPAIWWANTPASLRQDLLGWMSSAWAYIGPHTQAGAFQNWPYQGIADWRTAYYGANFPRLVTVKKRYDPADLFHYSQSIPVSA